MSLQRRHFIQVQVDGSVTRWLIIQFNGLESIRPELNYERNQYVFEKFLDAYEVERGDYGSQSREEIVNDHKKAYERMQNDLKTKR